MSLALQMLGDQGACQNFIICLIAELVDECMDHGNCFMVFFHTHHELFPCLSHHGFINVFVGPQTTCVIDPSATNPVSIHICFRPASPNILPRKDNALQIVWNVPILTTMLEY